MTAPLDRQFSISMRGYDREEVDAFKAEVLARLAELEARVASGESAKLEVGLDDVAAHRVELDAIGTEVDRILEAARAAAQAMRDRAAADASRWRSEADRETREKRDSAQADAEKMRGDAWASASEMIAQATEEGRALTESASDDSLYLRAESEREALRLTSEGRREREEMVRTARLEAERLLMAARSESEDILEAARQSAESAQERAKALEQRRAELLEELEAARTSIGQLEQEIDTRREALQIASTGAVTHASGQGDTPWLDDDGSVRVVPAVRIHEVEPVDADALAAEVEQMRAGRRQSVEPERPATPAKPEESETREEVEAADTPAEPQTLPAADGAEVATTEADVVPDPGRESDPVPMPGPEAVTDQRASAPPAPTTDETTVHEPLASDDLGDLFASLRNPAPPADETSSPISPAQVHESSVATDAPPRRTLDADPFDLRDRLLLPISNRALRAVKRDIVGLQNRVLEELRVGEDGWLPDRPLIAAAFGPEISEMLRESYVAGHHAAAEMVGASTPSPGGGRPSDATTRFVGALTDAVVDALRASDGGGTRQLSAAASRVFRAWRTDDAERRMRLAASRAYHEGVLAALAALGVGSVAAVCPGAICRDGCPAESGAVWDPSGGLPVGTAVPPVAPSCQSTIVPV